MDEILRWTAIMSFLFKPNLGGNKLKNLYERIFTCSNCILNESFEQWRREKFEDS